MHPVLNTICICYFSLALLFSLIHGIVEDGSLEDKFITGLAAFVLFPIFASFLMVDLFKEMFSKISR